MNTHRERKPRHSPAGLVSELYKEILLPFGSKNPRASGAGFFKRLSLFLSFLFIAAGASTVVSKAAERTPEILVLKDLLQEVADKNLEILAARKQELAAEARIPQARAWDDPQIGVTQWSIPSNFNRRGGVGAGAGDVGSATEYPAESSHGRTARGASSARRSYHGPSAGNASA